MPPIFWADKEAVALRHVSRLSFLLERREKKRNTRATFCVMPCKSRQWLARSCTATLLKRERWFCSKITILVGPWHQHRLQYYRNNRDPFPAAEREVSCWIIFIHSFIHWFFIVVTGKNQIEISLITDAHFPLYLLLSRVQDSITPSQCTSSILFGSSFLASRPC